MKRDNIISMAWEAGLWVDNNGIINGGDNAAGLLDFVALVAAAEREACAKVCEDIAEQVVYQQNSQEAADKCADAIRARGTL